MLKFQLYIVYIGTLVIYLYPANKMEYLLALLNKVQLTSPLLPLQKEVIVIQNAGMQHWLNMSIAQTRGISMNIDYALPAQFLWKLTRTLASKEKVPDQSPYSREVLSWRIYRLLNQTSLIEDEDFSHVVNYFSQPANFTQEHELSDNTNTFSVDNSVDDLKQYQLAVQLADLYEQYLIFRPEWLTAWQTGDYALTSIDDIETITESDSHIKVEQIKMITWQGKLWNMLQQESAYNPETLMQHAIDNLADSQHLLPPRISFLGINAMAPMWLSFIHELSQFTQVHFFHLNPCADYWGDIKTEKQVFKHIEDWTQDFNDIQIEVGNPLLANLGQQGREFLAMLQNYSTYQFDVFDSAELPNDSNNEYVNQSILHTIQHDILSLTDARAFNDINTEKTALPNTKIDDSITITSAHSALREVEGLHDWLLHQFNNNHDLTPKDVLVMCPQIEHYAPYVDAVFVRGWQELSSDIPPLPCSIADRKSKDSEPLISAFIDLLSLPDSRFQVNQLVGLLRLNAIQVKFNVNDDELDKISQWLLQASIHWGLDEDHKSRVLQSEASAHFTWQQGLSRLIRGFAFGDTVSLYRDNADEAQVLLPLIEGSDAILLGQLMLFLEQLQFHATLLNKNRTSLEWQQYLHNMIENCFSDIDSDAIEYINQAIEKMVEYSQEAHYQERISLDVIKSFLNNYFSQPDAGRQFMIGQVTFCSMLPMRSIPFKVIAVLGLNDGDFPRQRVPQAYDLMQQTPSRMGDRSRRGDDRYLFLEAIISARQALYLSYQGRNIKNNSVKQPSLVLKELFSYLSSGYGWQCDSDKPNCHIRQLPMQAFSIKNYEGRWASFDNKWLTLLTRSDENNRKNSEETHGNKNIKRSTDNGIFITHNIDTQTALTLDELVRFFVHPSKVFAQQQLDLSLNVNTTILNDNEPFTDNQLTSYLYRQAALAIDLSCELSAEEKQQEKQQLNLMYQLNGELPDLPFTDALCEKWLNNSEDFAKDIKAFANQGADNTLAETFELTYIDITLTIPISLVDLQSLKGTPQVASNMSQSTNEIDLTVRLPIYNNAIWLFRSSRAKAKDQLMISFYQLILQLLQIQCYRTTLTPIDQQTINNITGIKAVYFDTKAQKVAKYTSTPFEHAQPLMQLLLETYLKGQQQPLLLNVKLGEKYASQQLKNKAFEQSEFEQFWGATGSEQQNSMYHIETFSEDAYLQYFWPTIPNFDEHKALLSDIYLPIFSAVSKLK